mmetsp:Transcript_1397/g.2426  ORF Transcript_1397/g.2426 Transcript_1397/m.2426 type:complete len:182 (-) Transcript_1397:216-761(-)|eukprot:CAMPEP_0178754718 /NCGR_PEP_ID=MMETSP0744-20121128/12315_1 /TAXON_ID=913974 /ORGANISM="Nitzschia punctata, Strain CCMP561" /LENGTH=181 /DNA_ID=CAMNT_0020408661 /DNA_START=133 /DNA_END=678 /DNA_ORIENTATION=-
MTCAATSKDGDRQVAFADDITIYEFPIVIGDNPAVSSGCPITIGWKCQKKDVRNLEFYEYLRRTERRKDRQNLKMPMDQRSQLLLRSGCSVEKIAKAALKAEQAKDERLETLRKIGWDNFAMAIETTGKVPKGIFKASIGMTGDLLNTTGGIFASTLGGVGKQLSRTFGTSKPKTIQARSA